MCSQLSILCQVYNVEQTGYRPLTVPALIHQLYGKTGSASAGSSADEAAALKWLTASQNLVSVSLYACVH